MVPLSSPRSMARSSSRTPCSAPSWPGRGFGSRKYRSPTTTPTRSNTKACSMKPPNRRNRARLSRRSALFTIPRGRPAIPRLLPLVIDPDLGALPLLHADRQVVVEPRGDVVRDPDAAVRDGLDRDLIVVFAMDRVPGVIEEHREIGR